MSILRLNSLIVLLTVGSAWAAPVDFVVDLDSTLIFHPPRTTDEVIVAGGKNYGVAPGSGALLQSLSKIPEARVSFFTAHPLTKRNNDALTAILLPDGRSAKDLAFRVLHGTRVKRANKAPDPLALQPLFKVFWGDIKKDLNLVSQDIDLSRAVLIDDLHTNVLFDQEKSLLWLHNHSEDGELARARGLIEEALEVSDSEGHSLVDVLWNLQWMPVADDVLYQSETANRLELYQKGLALLREEDPAYSVSRKTLSALKKSTEIVNPPQPEGPFIRRHGTSSQRNSSN